MTCEQCRRPRSPRNARFCSADCAARSRIGQAGPISARKVPREQVLEQWDELRAAGFTRARAADAMGMYLTTLERVLYRARRDGDPRAVMGVRG